MSLEDTLRQNLSEAMHKGEKRRLATLRLLFAAVKNKEIEERKKEVGLGDSEILDVIQKEVKKRKDAIAEYERGGRHERAEEEREELAILQAYVPEELSDEEVRRVVAGGIRQLGGKESATFGSLMKAIMPTLKGRASGDRIAECAKEALEK